MSSTLLVIVVLLALSSIGYGLGRRRAFSVSSGHSAALHSRPQYYGFYVALWAALPSFFLVGLWLIFESYVVDLMLRANIAPLTQDLEESEIRLLMSQIKNLALANIPPANPAPEVITAAENYVAMLDQSAHLRSLLAFAAAIAGLAIGARAISPRLRARNQVERAVTVLMVIASTIAILTTVGIVLSLLFEAWRFFAKVPWYEFVFGLHWSPQTALRADQVGASGSFGAVPLFAGTMLITLIAMAVAVPIGLMSAVYMSEYAPPKIRATAKPMLEILAGVPTVVYGFFAALTVAPFFRNTGDAIGLTVASESALAAGVVMGIMIIPFVSSLSDDVMNAVPQTLRDGAYALGATKSETIKQVIMPAALPGIVGGVLLAVSRAIGETMIVVMAAGLAANLTANPLEAVTTVTVQIVTLLVGDQEFDSAKTLAAFALGLVLFVLTLSLNVVALRIVRKYREKYD